MLVLISPLPALFTLALNVDNYGMENPREQSRPDTVIKNGSSAAIAPKR